MNEKTEKYQFYDKVAQKVGAYVKFACGVK